MTLNADEIKQKLSGLDGWEVDGKTITKTFECDDFSHAMDFVVHVGEVAEEQDHHPDIDIRFSKVTVRLSTHSAGGVTEKDIQLAQKIENVF